MDSRQRMTYISYIVIAIFFIVVGMARNELDILTKVNNYSFDQWYNFLLPWVGTSEGRGLPVPW